MGARVHRPRFDAGRLALLAGVSGTALLMSLPLVWMLLGSLRTDTEILRAPFAWPERWRWDQWQRAWTEGNLAQYGWNSLWITTAAVVLVVALGAGAAYGLARGRTPRPRLLGFYLLGMIVPAQAAVVPTFLLLRTLHLLDTGWALVLPYAAWNLPFAVLVYYGFFRSQSREPEEAGRLDGCGPALLFWKVAFPLAAPATGVVVVSTALSTWNEFLFALLFVHSDSAKTLPLGLLAFTSAHTTDYGLTFAALALISAPLLLLFVFIQRTLIEGTAAVTG
jgi:ABC-type glycerol-3-phosphate transport system permease component